MNLDPFTPGYLEAALWSSCDENGTRFDRDYSLADIAHEAIHEAAEVCAHFQRDNEADLEAVREHCGNVKLGQLFRLDRNGHGTGYWDQGYGLPEETNQAFQRLSRASKAWGGSRVYVGDDGKIYLT